MSPYSTKIVNGETIRVPWPPRQATLKLNEFKRAHVLKARRATCARARELGVGHLIREMADGSFILDTREMIPATDKTEAVNRINPIAVQIKGELHNGREIIDLYRKDWIEFCSEPREPSQFEVPPAYASKAHKGERLSAIPAGMTVKQDDEKPKRINQRRSEKL